MRQKSSREIYSNRWMRLREDAVILNNGSEGIYGVVEKADFVVVVPFQKNGDTTSVWLVEQFRYPVGERFWEFPQGGREANTTPEDAARRELAEETGLQAAQIHYLGWVYHGYGYANQRMHAFAATDLTDTGKQKLDPEEGDLIYRKFDLAEVEDMIRTCRIKDAASMSAYSIWRLSKTYAP